MVDTSVDVPSFTNARDFAEAGNDKAEINEPDAFEDDSEDEKEDNTIRRTDSLLVAGKIVDPTPNTQS
jgi:hypothetical protein